MSGESSFTPRDPYHRPQQLWECGHACSRPCTIGPTSWGFCRERSEPCRPRLTILGKRGLWTGTIFLLTLAAILWASWPEWRHEMVSPGPLSSVHAQTLQSVSGGKHCDACHRGGSGDLVGWLTQTQSDATTATTQSQQCLSCHGPVFATTNFLNPHNLAAEDLSKLTAKQLERPVAWLDSLRVKFDRQQQLACATCHREHEGMSSNLSDMTNRQCQACHTHTIHAFEQGHPEFRERARLRSNIAFDHAAHLRKHFPGKQREFKCSQCHEDDADRNVKKLVDFQRACAECHTKPIDAAGMEGLVLFSLPTLNVSELTAKGINIGYWPDGAHGDFDGKWSPLMLTLLHADPVAKKALDELGTDFDFASIDVNNAQQLKAVAVVIQAAKKLLQEIALAPDATIKSRLEKLAGEPIPDSRWKAIMRQIPPALFRESQRRWFPQLTEELATAQGNSEAVPKFAEVPVFRNERASPKPSGGLANVPGITWWSKSDQPKTALTSSRKPNDQVDNLLAENPLRHLMQGKSNQATATPATAIQQNSPVTSPQTSVQNKSIEANLAKSNTSGELLADNPLASLKVHAKNTSPTILPSQPSEAEPATPEENAESEIVAPEEIAETTRTVASADLATNGAWFLDEPTFSIRYRPAGHGDEFLQLVLDVTARCANQAESKNLFAHLLTEQSAKSCTSCHSIAQQADQLQVQWQASYRDTSRLAFTSFSHRPHLIQPALQDCQHCHQMKTSNNVLANYESTLPLQTETEFLPVKQAQCVSCHNSTSSGGKCTQCHNYHVGMKKSH